jgi:drug/metabolite transporter (DMT)-like permease
VKAFWPLAAAAATGVQVGAALAATRLVVHEAGPATIALWRYAIGCLCLLPFFLHARASNAPVVRRDLLPVALLGIAQFGLVMALLNHALASLPAARVSLVFASFPLLTMLIAAFLRHEALSLGRSLGVLLTLAGVALGLHEAFRGGFEAADLAGAAAALAAAFVGALCSVLYRPYLRRNPTLPLSLAAMAAAVLALAAWSALRGDLGRPLPFSGGGWVAMVFIGLSSGLGFLLWQWALRHASPTRVTMFLGLAPPTAALLDTWWLGEPLTAWLVGSVALVGAGLWVALDARGPSQPATPRPL